MEQNLAALFNALSDEALFDRVRRGVTDEAAAVAEAEVRRRGLEWPLPALGEVADDAPYLGDRVVLERGLDPTEAHLMSVCLQQAGIQATPADTHTVQMNSLWFVALGGAKVRVPASQLGEAREVMVAYRRGDFTLDDTTDLGQAED